MAYTYRMSQKKFPPFENSWHHEYFTDLIASNSSWKPKDRSIFVIFLAVLPALEVSVNVTISNFMVAKWLKKGQKHWSNCNDCPFIEQYVMGGSRLSSYTTSSKQILRLFCLLAIYAQRISFTHKQLHFLHWSLRSFLYDLINVLGPFSVIFQPKDYHKVEFIDNF